MRASAKREVREAGGRSGHPRRGRGCTTAALASHAGHLHDTPAQGLFQTSARCFSFGYVRVERALERAAAHKHRVHSGRCLRARPALEQPARARLRRRSTPLFAQRANGAASSPHPLVERNPSAKFCLDSSSTTASPLVVDVTCAFFPVRGYTARARRCRIRAAEVNASGRKLHQELAGNDCSSAVDTSSRYECTSSHGLIRLRDVSESRHQRPRSRAKQAATRTSSTLIDRTACATNFVELVQGACGDSVGCREQRRTRGA